MPLALPPSPLHFGAWAEADCGTRGLKGGVAVEEVRAVVAAKANAVDAVEAGAVDVAVEAGAVDVAVGAGAVGVAVGAGEGAPSTSMTPRVSGAYG